MPNPTLALMVELVYNNKERQQMFKDAIAMIAYDYNMTKQEVVSNNSLLRQALREAVCTCPN